MSEPVRIKLIRCTHCGRRVAAAVYRGEYPTWRVCAACRGGQQRKPALKPAA